MLYSRKRLILVPNEHRETGGIQGGGGQPQRRHHWVEEGLSQLILGVLGNPAGGSHTGHSRTRLLPSGLREVSGFNKILTLLK